jgi:integrative and conjugative element protein (TIGR02256 family)
MADVDVAVSTMADEAAESFVNEVAVRAGRPVYYVRALRGGAAGRIFRVIPGRDACKYCLGLAMAGRDEQAAWLKVDDLEDMLIAHECGNPVLASSAADLAMISALAAKVIVDDVGREFGPSNHWLWAAEGVQGHPALSTPFRLVERAVGPDPRCLYCGPPPVRRVVVPAPVFTRMADQVRRAGRNETGGVLVGRIEEDGTARIVDASGAGPRAVETPDRFDRDVAYCQRWIEARVRSGRCAYVGEWHSHTSGEARPSALDAESLSGIACADSYCRPTPVLVIVKSEEGEIVERGAFSFAPHRPYRDAELVVASATKRARRSGAQPT